MFLLNSNSYAATDPNPVMACNDNVIISLGAPDGVDDNWTDSLNDDLGECVIKVLPDMVLEGSQCLANEYEVIIYGSNNMPLVVYSSDGFPLDAAGFPIHPNSNVPEAHDLVSAAEVGLTLNYIVEHIDSGNRCWGTLTVVNHALPQLICKDYDLACNDPNALDEFYEDYPFPYETAGCAIADVKLLSERIKETNCNQSDWNGAQIIRIWQAIDQQGNASTCTQTVNLKAPLLSDINAPADVTLECEDQEPQDIPLSMTGLPTLGDEPLNEYHHSLCDITYAYEDIVLPTCGNGYKILRRWTILNWCSGATRNFEQLIKVEDTIAPVVTNNTLIVDTDNFDCEGSFTINDLNIVEDCSALISATASYGSNGQLTVVDLINGGIVDDLPVGDLQVTISVADECMNTRNKMITVRVRDRSHPIPICKDGLNLTLNNDGMASIFATDIDEGSFDNCGAVGFSIRRVGGCVETSAWADTVDFESCDVGNSVKVELRVIDASGNSAKCTTNVFIDASIEANTLLCNDYDLPCNHPHAMDAFYDEFPAAYTIPMGSSIESVELLSEVLQETNCEADNASGAYIERTWQATTVSGYSSTCVQKVYLKAPAMEDIQFPADVDFDCPTALEDLTLAEIGIPAFEGYTVAEDHHGVCDVSYSYEDVILSTCGNSYNVIRTWTMINWCTGISKSAEQIIVVSDNEAPVIAADELVIAADATTAMGTLTLDQLEISDNCNELISVIVSYYTPGGALILQDMIGGADLTLAMGLTDLTIEAIDACMNATGKDILVNVVGDTFEYTCPDNVIVSPEELSDDLSVYGAPSVTGGTITNYEEVTSEDVCGSASIDRTWTIIDSNGDSYTCVQQIVVQGNSNFIVQFPADSDATTINCLFVPYFFDQPLIIGADSQLIAVSVEDEFDYEVDDACFYAYRTWTIINWCVYDETASDNTDLGIELDGSNLYQDNGDGYFRYTQRIRVISLGFVDTVDEEFSFSEETYGEGNLVVGQNYPNPVALNTTIPVKLAAASALNLRVYDTNGRVLESLNYNFEKGAHQIELNSEKWNTSGVLYYQISTETEHFSGTMIKI